ncbi:4-coumarate--CoA ligase 1-like isoform X2 [Leguminivora glycinivorella]|uniref:4-coumarate--CoA ligase 1-like isoform X2 n=1 Tax=Leguminivora glycinivorella TaxID=1035111 RepID=UPI002010775F|nr:4-coumarate--CoA ligase 1-like isoform X2 [Leguminivora glycinivorella]
MLVHGAGEVLVPAHLHFGKFILDRLRETDPERNCLISNTTKYNLTFKEVSQFVVRLSVGLTQQGVGKGDTVVVAAILKHKLNLTKPKYIICTRKFLEAFSDVLKGSNFIKTFICFDDVEGMESVATLVSSQEVDMDQFEPTAVEGQTDVALISFSSGTTGLSKGVLLTHLNLIARSISITQWYFDYNSLYAEPLQVGFFSEPDRTSFYDFNMMCTLLCSGQTVVYSESDVDLKYVKEFQVHTMPTVPAIIEMMVNAPDLSSLKLVCTVGSPLNRRTAKLLQERYPGIKLVNLYGTTETGSITTTQNKAFDFDVVQQDPKADGYCVGYAVPGVTIKVVDVETRKILGPNQRGELCVRGPRLMKDYLGATEPYLDEQGYYLTGDLGYFDDQKRIYLVNRLKDVINYMGQKVSPGDVESVLLQHPAVQEAAVVGKPAGVEGEELPTAFVVLRAGTAATETELVHYVAKQVTWYMQLRGGVRFVLELPRNAMQKVLRRRLREILTQE